MEQLTGVELYAKVEQEVSNGEVVRIMIDGGKKLCDYALEQWIANKYQMDEEARRYHITRWKVIKDRITVVGHALREAIHD